MYRIFVMLVALLLSGCVTTEEAVKNKQLLEEQAKEAMSEAHRCGLRNVADLDDKLSDASTIALGIAMKCQAEHTNAIRMYAISRNMVARDVEWLVRAKTTRDERINFYLGTVLNNRKQNN